MFLSKQSKVRGDLNMPIAQGTVTLGSVKQTNVYAGKDTGTYQLVLLLDDSADKIDTSADMESKGVKVKEYEGTPQRKFTTNFAVPVVDTDGKTPFAGEIPRGSVVRIAFKYGNPHPQHGTPCYMDKVRIVSLGEADNSADEEDL